MGRLSKIKQISFSDQILMHAKERTKEMGVSFPEYVRHLVLNDLKSIRDRKPYVSEEEEKALKRSMKDLKKGEFTNLKNKDEIDSHFEQLLTD